MNQGEITIVENKIDLTFTASELNLLWLSLLCAGHGQLPTPDRESRRVELTDEARIRARDLADSIHLSLRAIS